MSHNNSIYFWYWKKEIPHETCQKLINLGEGKWNQATTFKTRSEKNPSADVRKSDVVWINEKWVYDLIYNYLIAANDMGEWKYNISGAEDCQVTRYTKDGYYSWHMDGIGSHKEAFNYPGNKSLHGNVRKLSMTIILNSDFEGGDFEIRRCNEQIPKLEEGTVIVFPSFLEHRVAPVTEGIRYSLVSWFIGPPFV